MTEIFYTVICRKTGTSTRKPALLRTRYVKDVVIEGDLVIATQRHSDLGYATRKLRFAIPEGVNLQADDQFTSTVVFAGGKKYSDAAVQIIRETRCDTQYVTFKVAV